MTCLLIMFDWFVNGKVIEKSIHTTMSFGHHIITATIRWVFALSSNTFKMFTAEIEIHF